MKESSTKLFVIALIGTICFCLFIFIKQLIKEYKSRNSILNGYFVSADMFLKKWNERYKNETWNKSGCYVILIYSHAIKEFHKEKYEAIYIGQSLHLANRVKQHLQGNGNKNVYHDYQNGKQIYIHLERCMPSYMNRMEKDLIRSFKATYFNKKDVYKYIGYFADKLKGIVIWEKTNPQPSINKIKDENGNILTSVCNAVEYFFVLNEQAEEFRAYGSIKNIVHSSVNEKHFKGHGAIMKYEIADWFVKNFSVKGDTIVDPFLGTGTTAIASELNKRKYVGYEISNEYCQIAKKRIAIETSTLF